MDDIIGLIANNAIVETFAIYNHSGISAVMSISGDSIFIVVGLFMF